MADENRYSDDEKNPKRGGEFKVPPRTWIVWIAIFGGIILLMLFKDRMEKPLDQISQHRFQQLLESNLIVSMTVNYSPQSPALNEIVGTYRESSKSTEVPFRAKVRLTPNMEEKLFSGEYPNVEPKEPNTMLMNVAFSVLPFVIIAALIWFFFIRQIKKIPVQAKAIATEQQDRYDTILFKWEDQARRMDAVLEKMERDTGIKK